MLGALQGCRAHCLHSQWACSSSQLGGKGGKGGEGGSGGGGPGGLGGGQGKESAGTSHTYGSLVMQSVATQPYVLSGLGLKRVALPASAAVAVAPEHCSEAAAVPYAPVPFLNPPPVVHWW